MEQEKCDHHHPHRHVRHNSALDLLVPDPEMSESEGESDCETCKWIRNESNTNIQDYNTQEAESRPLIHHRIEGQLDFDKGKGSVLSSTVTLANTAIGAGILSFGFAFENAGIIGGFILTLFLGTMMALSLFVLGKAAHETRTFTYQEMIEKMLGKTMGTFMSFILAIYLFGCLVGFEVVIGDMCTDVFNSFYGELKYARPLVMTVFSVIFVFPLCLLKRVEVLGITAFFAILVTAYITALTSVKGIEQMVVSGIGNLTMFNFSWNFFQALPLITFAMTSHPTAIPIYAALSNHSSRVRRFTFASFSSIAVCSTLYLPVGFFGYVLFTSETDGDIMCNFPLKTLFPILGRLTVAIAVTLAYPINNFPCRLAIISLFLGKKTTNFRIYTTTIVTFILALITAILAPGIAVVFSLLGSTCGMLLVYIFPAMCVIKLKINCFLKYLLACLFTLLAIIIGVSGTADVVAKLIRNDHSRHVC